MIVREYYLTREDGIRLFRTYSNAGFTLIRNDGVEYDEAIDVEGAPYTYTESANKRETDDVVNEINELEKSVI